MMECRHGAIVTMSSNSSRLFDFSLTASYATANASIVQFTRQAAKELPQYGVRVNCVAPATTLSERLDEIMSDELRERVRAMSPLGHLGMPRDSALARPVPPVRVGFVVTGITLDVAGGRTML
jgi:3-oxoacyl-[acyl-carrier protein] reductase